jgi:hypothetical protein
MHMEGEYGPEQSPMIEAHDIGPLSVEELGEIEELQALKADGELNDVQTARLAELEARLEEQG